jgi:uncharacterized repeat protein (TIGR01451 family)
MNIYRLFSIIITMAMLLSFVSAPGGAVIAAPLGQAGLPALQITKTADAPQVTAGGLIGFTMVARNTGQGTSTNTQLIDFLPVGTTWSFDNPDCFITAEGWLVCEFGDLTPGEEETVHLTATSSEAMCGKVSNRAAVFSNNHPKKASNTAVVTVTCPTAGLVVTKLPDDAQVAAGEAIGFTLTVLNNSAGTANDVELTDQLAAGLGWTENSTACAIDANDLLTCAFGDLAPGASASVHVSAASTAGMCGVLENTATATASNISGEVTATATIDILCVPDLTVDKTAGPSPVEPGDTIRFTLLVSSLGSGVIENATLQDQLPSAPGLSWTVESVTGGANCSIANNLLSCTFGDLPAGQTRTVVVSSPTTAASCGVLDNTATVTATNEGDAEEDNNSDSASITVNCLTLTIDKTADDPQVNANDPIGFTITVTNTGQAAATGVTLEDQLSTDTTWSDDSAACTISAGGLLSCNFGNLAPGASASVHVTATSNVAMCGLLENTATAAAGNLPGEVSDTATINIGGCAPFITVRKTAEEIDISAGEFARFNIVVTNTGSVAAENVTITDPLPVAPDVVWTFDNVLGGGTCEINAGVLSCNFGTLDPGESASVRISSPTTLNTCGNLVNTVTATATNDPLDAFDIAEILVNCGADVTIQKTAEDNSIEAGATARFTITAISHGTETATGVTLEDTLPTINGLVWTLESVTGAGTCNLTGNVVQCSFGNMAPGETRTLVISSPTLSATFCQPLAVRLIGNFAFVEATNEVAPSTFDNSAYAEINVTCPIIIEDCPPIVYFNDFNSGGLGPEGWTNYRTSISPNKTTEFLGQYGNEDVTFQLENPEPERCPRNMILVSFDLFMIRSWDGNIVQVAPIYPIVGPDHWRFGLQNPGGSPTDWAIDSSFTNYSESIRSFFKQSYPLPFPTGAFPAKTGAVAFNTLGYQFGGPRDSTYRISFMIPNDDPIVRLLWQGEGLQALEDESWGIDNFRLEMVQVAPFGGNRYWFPVILRPSR